jgi:hypothetical protein
VEAAVEEVDKQLQVELDQQAHLLVVGQEEEEEDHLRERMVLHLVVKVVQHLVTEEVELAIQVV